MVTILSIYKKQCKRIKSNANENFSTHKCSLFVRLRLLEKYLCIGISIEVVKKYSDLACYCRDGGL